MYGIQSYGTYVPFYRLKKSTVAAAYGGFAKRGEKAVAYYDEDSLTMAVAASMEAAYGKNLESVMFATTTAPYKEKLSATQIAACLNAPKQIRTMDFAGSLRCASDAMLAAKDSGLTTLVATGDCRLGACDGQYENDLGDGAAAYLLGSDDVIAEIVDSVSLSMDIHDMWRNDEDRYVRFWDVRFANSTHYEPMVKQAVKELLAKTGLTAADITYIVNYAHEDRHRTAVAAKLGFTPEQIPMGLYGEIGNTGAAAAPMLLNSVLDTAKAGDKILYVSYGDGCTAILLQVTENIEKGRPAQTVAQKIAHKDSDLPYGKYLKWKDFLDCEPQRRPDQERSSLPDLFRNYQKNNAMFGTVCKCCGTPQFPPQRVCAKCHAVDEMEPYCFIGKKATVRTYTLDGQSISKDPPNYLVVVDFQGGGKMMTYMVDCKADEVHVGMEVELSFRKLFTAGGVHTYFWKVIPAKEGN